MLAATVHSESSAVLKGNIYSTKCVGSWTTKSFIYLMASTSIVAVMTVIVVTVVAVIVMAVMAIVLVAIVASMVTTAVLSATVGSS